MVETHGATARVSVDILPFRKIAFAKKFGFTVRDLMMLRALEQNSIVSSIRWFERPDLPHEYMRQLLAGSSDNDTKTDIHSRLDRFPVGAIAQGRRWAATSMHQHDAALRSPFSQQRIILDFNPFYIPPIDVLKGGIYWYDFIDNFSKHNRFSQADLAAVRRKYDFVRQHADVVTGVSVGAIEGYPNAHLMPNRLLRGSVVPATADKIRYDLGFLGFLTDKFDFDLLERVTAAGHTVLVCGHAYDQSVVKRLRGIPRVTYHGPFNAADVPNLTSQFSIGLIPYRLDRSHDESPIKFLQYLVAGRPTIMPKVYGPIEERFSEFVHVYAQSDDAALSAFIRKFAGGGATSEIQRQALAEPDLFWEDVIERFIHLTLQSGRSTGSQGE